MITPSFPMTERQRVAWWRLRAHRRRVRTKPIPPMGGHIEIPTLVRALTCAVLIVCGLVSTIAISAYVFDPVRRPSTTVRADGGSAWTESPLRGAAASLPKIDDRVPQ